MSPEQVIGKAIDARSDIFSLGVVLYEALTGVAPFDGDNVNAIMYATVNTSPAAPSTHNKRIPAMLDLIVAKAMAKGLDDRYQSIKELGDDLRQVRRQLDASKPQAALRATTAPPPQPKSASAVIDTGTFPMKPAPAEKPAAAEDPAGALSLAKTFDSFDATLRLASMTNQADEFRDYITSTQKMRAYRGKIEADSPVAKDAPPTAPAPEPPQISLPNPDFPIRPRQAIPTNPPVAPPQPSRLGDNFPAIVAIVFLTVAAIALAVALVLK